jgi:hypothetical protein
MKTKRKNGNKGKKGSRRIKKHYPAWVLALVLAAVLLLEGGLANATAADWQEAMTMFDYSETAAFFTSNMDGLMQPVVDVIDDVNKFYVLASEEMYYLLEGEMFPEVEEVISAVNEFYNQAADEMMVVLDLSEQGRVAGISIER